MLLKLQPRHLCNFSFLLACKSASLGASTSRTPQQLPNSTMPPQIIPDDEDYASSEDSDFAPDAGTAQGPEDSSDEESEAEEEAVVETKKGKPRSTKKRKRGDEEAEDAGFENSGDEAIIERGLKKQRKKKGKDEDDDEGGVGGLIKTRSMRAQEYVMPALCLSLC